MRLLSTLSLLAAFAQAAAAQQVVASPDGRTQVTVDTARGGLFYRVDRDKRPLLLALATRLRVSRRATPLRDGLRITGATRALARHDLDPALGRGRARSRPP